MNDASRAEAEARKSIERLNCFATATENIGLFEEENLEEELSRQLKTRVAASNHPISSAQLCDHMVNVCFEAQ